MSTSPSSRWNPGFIAMRWRSVFWLLALLGLVAGMVVHFQPYLTENTAKGTILVRPLSATSHGTPLQNPTDIAAATLRSEVVLWQTVIDLDLPEEWGMEGEVCVPALKDRITSRPVRKGVVRVSVKGHSRSEAIKIWNKLIEVAGDEFVRMANPLQQAALKALNAEVDVQEKTVSSTRKALRMAMDSEAYSRKHQKIQSPETIPVLPNTLPNFPRPRSRASSIANALSAHRNAVASFEGAQGKLEAELKKMPPFESPFIVQIAPTIPPPAPLGTSLHSLFKYSSIGLGSGMVLAVVLAYLLEWLFPRKTPTG